MSTSSNTGTSTTEEDQPKGRTKKKTLGASRKSKGTSMVDIVSAAPTGTGYLETNPYQGQETSGTAAEEPGDDSGAVNSDNVSPEDAQQAESSSSPFQTHQEPPSPPTVDEHQATPANDAESTAATEAIEPAAPPGPEESSASGAPVSAAAEEPGDDSGAVNSDNVSPEDAQQAESSSSPFQTHQEPPSPPTVDEHQATPANDESAVPKVSNWTVHAKNARAALLGVTKALDKVDARAQDVAEVLRTAGPSLPERDLVAIVYEVASRTGHPVSEIVQVANLDLPANSGS